MHYRTENANTSELSIVFQFQHWDRRFWQSSLKRNGWNNKRVRRIRESSMHKHTWINYDFGSLERIRRRERLRVWICFIFFRFLRYHFMAMEPNIHFIFFFFKSCDATVEYKVQSSFSSGFWSFKIYISLYHWKRTMFQFNGLYDICWRHTLLCFGSSLDFTRSFEK